MCDFFTDYYNTDDEITPMDLPNKCKTTTTTGGSAGVPKGVAPTRQWRKRRRKRDFIQLNWLIDSQISKFPWFKNLRTTPIKSESCNLFSSDCSENYFLLQLRALLFGRTTSTMTGCVRLALLSWEGGFAVLLVCFRSHYTTYRLLVQLTQSLNYSPVETARRPWPRPREQDHYANRATATA